MWVWLVFWHAMGNCQARRRRRRAERTSETWQSIDCRVEMPVYISLKWPIFAKLWESQKLLDALGFGWPVGCPTASRSLNISTCLMCTLYILVLRTDVSFGSVETVTMPTIHGQILLVRNMVGHYQFWEARTLQVLLSIWGLINCSSWESLFQEWRFEKFALKLLLARHCKTEHVFARKAHRIAAMIRWGMSRQPCSFHTCCDRSNCLLWYRICFCYICYRRSSRAVGVLVISTLCDWLRFIDWFRSEPAVLLYVAPSYLKFFDCEDMRARAAVAASWIRPA